MGLARRALHLSEAFARSGVDVRSDQIMDPSVVGFTSRVVRTVVATKTLYRNHPRTNCELIVLSALGSPQMMVLGLLLSFRRRVVVDVCDSCIGSLAVAARRGERLALLKAFCSVVVSVLLRFVGVFRTYISEPDLLRDARLHGDSKAGVIGPHVQPELADMEGFYGPPKCIVVPADFSSPHNMAGFEALVQAVIDAPDTLVPIRIYGPCPPPTTLPDGVEYLGFAEHLTDVYVGECAVFAPNLSGAGMQNKVWEALCAGRRVLTGGSAAVALFESPLIVQYGSESDLPSMLQTLIAGAQSPSDCAEWRSKFVATSVSSDAVTETLIGGR